MDKEILEAKKKLYSLLLQKKEHELTDNEVDIRFHLAKDKQIQDFLQTQIQGFFTN